MRKLLLSILALCIGVSTSVSAEETSPLPVIGLADIINYIEERCPCADITESEEEEEREENSPVDQIDDFSNGKCRSQIANPGKFRQGIRYLITLGVVELEEGKTLKDVFSAFKEVRKDCRGGGKKTKPEKKPERPER